MKPTFRALLFVFFVSFVVPSPAADHWDASLKKVVLYYPSADVDDSPLQKRIILLIELMRKENDPLMHQADAPWKIATMAAQMLQIAPVQPAPVAQVPAAPRPHPGPVNRALLSPDLAKTFERDDPAGPMKRQLQSIQTQQAQQQAALEAIQRETDRQRRESLLRGTR